MDIDDELEMLQRQLMEVQQQKTNPLSQRTVAQIMIKLHQQGFKFYATTDGNQYVTPHKLDNQIIQFVNERGRTKIGILPQILNLNQDLIESRISHVCQKSTHIQNNDNLISRQYIRNFIHSIKQKLEIDGVVQLNQLGLVYQFNKQFLMKIIQQNLEHLDGQINQNQLVTRQYRRMKKRRILGFLLAISRPVNIQTILKSVKLSEANSQAIIQELISEGKLKGRCQNSYYIPQKFSKNQKQMIRKFFQNNGFIDFSMLQKNYQVSKPEQWIKKNFKDDFVIFQQVCFNQTKLDSYKNQIQSLLKSEGFFEISNVVPFQMDDRKMQKFLSQICGINQFVLDQGRCYSQQWLNKCVNQFRDKVIFDIFFKKNEAKGKKKGNKKEKQSTLTQQQLTQTLFEAGLAQYSVAQGMALSLLPIITQRFQALKGKLQKQLSQNQGIINNAFLKYKKCKTIMKTNQSLQRSLNTIQKQKKKGGTWSDPDFGPSQTNPQGKFSLIYYDGIAPKQWGQIQNIKWVEIPLSKLLAGGNQKSRLMGKSMLFDLLQVIDHFNLTNQNKLVIQTPNISKLPYQFVQGQQQPTPPFSFRFFTNQKQCKYVLIDNKMPFINEQMVGSSGIYGLIQKAYAKLRYCYKGILGVGVNQLITQVTGLIPEKMTIQNNKDEERVLNQILQKHICSKKLVLGIGEGIAGKKIKIQGQQSNFRCMKPYLISQIENQQNLVKIYPGQYIIEAKLVPKIFKNIYIL